MVALTFDDGPGQYTNSILDTLSAYNAHATFFVVGQNIDEETGAVMQRAVGMGCESGSHTQNHADLVKADADTFRQQIQQADENILKAIGRYPYFLRPPYGDFNDDVRRHVGKPLAFWSVDTKDWKTRNTACTVSAALNNIEDGDVVLMHDIYGETADAVAQIVPSSVMKTASKSDEARQNSVARSSPMTNRAVESPSADKFVSPVVIAFATDGM